MVQATRDTQRANWAPKTPSGASGYFLFLLGLGVAAFGYGLVQPPAAVPHADWIATKFARMGIYGVPFIAAGLTIFCFGFVQRLQARVGRSLSQGTTNDNSGEVERLAHELGQVRAALGNVQTELLANKQRQDSMLESIQTVTAKKKDGEGDSNAMFRLAASLDQLGARIEERLKLQGQSFESCLQDVTTSVVRAQQEVTEAVDQVVSSVDSCGREIQTCAGDIQELKQREPVVVQAPQPTESFTQTTTQTVEDCAPTVAQTTQPEFVEDDLGYEECDETPNAEEDLQIFVELEETEETVAAVEEPAPAMPQESSLGILDSLDDYGTMVEPPVETPAEPTQNQNQNPLRMAGNEPSSPLPGQNDPMSPSEQPWPPRLNNE